jgi:hypothetical protein
MAADELPGSRGDGANYNELVFNPDAFHLDQCRARLQRMDDAALERFGKAAAYIASPATNLGHPPREPFLVQLREARVEWNEGYPGEIHANSR